MSTIRSHQSATISASELVDLITEMQKTPEYRKKLAKRVESWKPAPGNKCKNDGCNGEVVQRVAGINSDGYFYRNPACDVCNREYLGATNVRTTGIREFEKMMNTPYGL